MHVMSRPHIGITVDSQDGEAGRGRYQSAMAYSRAVACAGGLPVLLPHEPTLAADYVDGCDALLLTGGNDPATESFGQATDRRARLIDPRRQAFELALLDAAGDQPDKPVLGVCLGMQMMALHAGGRLHQYLPDTLGPRAAAHQDNRLHAVTLVAGAANPLGACMGETAGEAMVVSSHRQAVAAAGALRVLATAADGTIEAVADPGRRFYIGVQWHPERAEAAHAALNALLLRRFVAASRAAT